MFNDSLINKRHRQLPFKLLRKLAPATLNYDQGRNIVINLIPLQI